MQKKMVKREKGITLVALVVTIIVLVILASISISFVIKQDGILNQAKQAQELSKIGEYKERIDLILAEEVLKSNLENKPITITGLIERFNKESFIGSAERIDVEEIETKGTIRLITTDGYIYEVILDGENISCISQGKDDGEPYPTITLEQLPMQGIENEKIQIKVTGEVARGKETTGIAYVERIDNKEKKDYQQGGVVFEIEENGTYLFSVTTNKGKSQIGKIIINITQPKDSISIISTPTTVTNKELEVTIKYGETTLNNSNKYQYRIGTEGSWQTATNNTITTKVSENEIIVARYYDGKNSFKVQNYNIQNIDKVAPNVPTVNLNGYTSGNWTNGNITITLTSTDSGSIGCASENIGINTYQYSKDNGIWQNIGTTLIINTDQNSTYKFRSIDKAGNIGRETEIYTVKRDTTIPTIPTTRISSGTAGNNGWYRSNVGVTITSGTDSGSGVNRVVYALSGAISKGETEIQNGGTITITSEGTTNVTTYTYDNAGNKSSAGKIIVKKDTIAPTIPLVQDNTWSKEYNKTITANITDNASGVNIKKYKDRDRDTWYFSSGNGSVFYANNFVVNTASADRGITDGPSNLYTIYAKDNAGNESINKIAVQNLLLQNNLNVPRVINVKSTIDGTYINNFPNGIFNMPYKYEQYGPYWNLQAGTYQITYLGNNLDYYKTIKSYSNNAENYATKIVRNTSNELTYTISLNSYKSRVEVYLLNESNITMTINSLTLTQLN